jgi:hypothetical protein
LVIREKMSTGTGKGFFSTPISISVLQIPELNADWLLGQQAGRIY